MRVFITGGTGSIGRGLVARLKDRGDQPVVLSRQADRARMRPSYKGVEVVQGDPAIVGGWERAVDGCDAVVNLAGHNIFADRWSPEVKRKIRDSRVETTENVVGAIAKAARPPKVLVSASAIGFYGPHGDEELTEDTPPGHDFLAGVCREWEDAARGVETLATRLAIVRIGIVLDPGHGALGAMVPVFRWLPGGAAPIGGGRVKLLYWRQKMGQQWMSWVHHADIVGILLMALDNAEARGVINGTAPNPVRNAEFSRALARAVRRPFLPIGPPDALIRLALGDAAEILTTGQRVLPRRASELGYSSRFPTLEAALADLFPRRSAAGAPKEQPTPAGG